MASPTGGRCRCTVLSRLPPGQWLCKLPLVLPPPRAMALAQSPTASQEGDIMNVDVSVYYKVWCCMQGLCCVS